MSLYTFLLLLQLPVPFFLRCYKVPRAAAQPYPMRRTIPAEGNGTSFILALWHEKALLFLQTASLGPLLSPRYFFPLQNSRGDINTHIRERGLRRGRRFEATYNMDIVLVPSKNFLSFRHRRPSNFSYSFSNRLALDSASCASRILESPCQGAFVRSSCIARYCLSTSFRVYIPEVARVEINMCHDQFSTPEESSIISYNNRKIFQRHSLCKTILMYQ